VEMEENTLGGSLIPTSSDNLWSGSRLSKGNEAGPGCRT
jgi:hypothetical protein